MRSQRAAPEIAAIRVDLFVLVFQVWAEDVYLLSLVQAIRGRPLAIWCYIPWDRPPRPLPFGAVLQASGPVGTLEGLGTLRNLGVNFLFTSGASKWAHPPRPAGFCPGRAGGPPSEGRRSSGCSRRATSRCKAPSWMSSDC